MWTSEVDFVKVVGIILVEVSGEGWWHGVCLCGVRCQTEDLSVIDSWAVQHNKTCDHPTKDLLR